MKNYYFLRDNVPPLPPGADVRERAEAGTRRGVVDQALRRRHPAHHRGVLKRAPETDGRGRLRRVPRRSVGGATFIITL